MSPLTCKIEPSAEGTRACLSGEITEDSDFAALLQSGGAPLTVDLAEVSRINSCGVREWINFVQALGPRSLVLERCSVPVVAQLNMITNFAGKGRVQSVYAPFFCTPCDRQHLELVKTTGLTPGSALQSMKCPSCGAEMELDDLPETYWAFLAG